MELEVNMASLDISDKKKRRLSGLFHPPPPLEQEDTSDSSESPQPSESSSPVQLRRSTRKKIRISDSEKRRVISKPKKLIDTSSLNEIKSYYLDKRVKRLPSTLETIYEEPQQNKSEVTFMSSRKFKRVINFSESVKNSIKVKRRRMKAKGISATKRVNNKKFTIDFLMKKLAGLDDE